MSTRPSVFCGLAVTVLLAAGVAVSAHAQPGDQPVSGERERSRATGQPTLDAKGLRELLERRMEEHRANGKRIEEALQRLNGGADAATVSREYFDAIREARRPGAGTRGAPAGEEGAGSPGAQRPGKEPGGGMGRGSEFGMFGGPKLSAEERAAAIKVLEDRHPDLVAKVVALAGGSSETLSRFKEAVAARVRTLEATREKDPEEAALRLTELSTGLDLMRLGRELADAKKQGNLETAGPALRARLVEALSTQFDARQQLSKLLLKRLREGADKQEAEIIAKDNDRAGLINKRTEDFLKMIERGRRGESREGESAPSAKP